MLFINLNNYYVHCRFLVPDNTQKILTEFWHHFWLKNDDEKWCRKNYLEIPQWAKHFLENLFKLADRMRQHANEQSFYSRVHISSDTAFLKILNKPSIVQE